MALYRYHVTRVVVALATGAFALTAFGGSLLWFVFSAYESIRIFSVLWFWTYSAAIVAAAGLVVAVALVVMIVKVLRSL